MSQLLNFLETWHPPASLSLKQITLKIIALLAISSSDRGQTLHLANIDDMVLESDCIKFVIKDRLKTTRKILKPKIITCPCSEKEHLNVFVYVNYYLELTKDWRHSTNRKLLLSWRTKSCVTRPTVARWLKTVLKLSGIDTGKYQSHSYRGAGLSNAFFKGVPISQIVAHGSWKNVRTFSNHYCAPSEESDVGKIILRG